MQKKKKIMAVNASGVLKLVLTGANSQKKKSQDIFSIFVTL